MEITSKTHVEVKPFKFTGNASEYFRIWIINVGLTILTLGIYSAWAKVRSKRYFYSNTYLDDTTFEYLAEPLKILKGRLIAVAVFAVYIGVTRFYPLGEIILIIAFIVLLPWLVIKALAFNAINSSYRNIHFNFKANFYEAGWLFFGIPFAILFTFGLAYPYFVFRRYQFTINNSYYGTTAFSFEAKSYDFSNIYFKAIGLFIFATLVLGLLVFSWSGITRSNFSASIDSSFLGGLVYLVFFAYLKTNVTNFVFSHTHLGKLRLESTLQFKQMLWLYLSNAIGIMLSLGLLIPWAKIRMLHYRLAHLKLHVTGGDDLNNFVAAEQEKVSATGEELSDLFDIEIGL